MEEPYEWHKNGLTEYSAINLKAPRKCRFLRERTGHGAFYGMRSIIYGESIATPLVRQLGSFKICNPRLQPLKLNHETGYSQACS